MYHSGRDEYGWLDGHGWMTMWQREVGDDGKTIGRSHTVLQRIWYATEMKGTQLSGLLLLDIASSGHIHRVIVADEGEWKFEEGIWKFVNSTILNVCPKDSTFGILQVITISKLLSEIEGQCNINNFQMHLFCRRIETKPTWKLDF
jgi:hypothetical protein